MTGRDHTRQDLADAVGVPVEALYLDERTVVCPCCGHTETGPGWEPHDAMTTHYATHRRALACGCQWRDDPYTTRGQLWTCDQHAPAYLRERTEWRLCNHYGRRWSAAATRDPQPSLFHASTSLPAGGRS